MKRKKCNQKGSVKEKRETDGKVYYVPGSKILPKDDRRLYKVVRLIISCTARARDSELRLDFRLRYKLLKPSLIRADKRDRKRQEGG